MEELPPDGESTAEALLRLVGMAGTSIDLTAMYWSLRPSARDEDLTGWSVPELIGGYGAARGVALYEALGAAARRGVEIRVLESRGFVNAGTNSDSAALAAEYPDHVTVRSVNLHEWYGAGIMHQKLWIFDAHSIYVGSANTDWRSLSQVKELGIVVESAVEVAAEALRLFDSWWVWAALDANGQTVDVFDSDSQIQRRVPAWSVSVARPLRRTSPFDLEQSGAYGWDTPLSVTLGDEDGELLLSGAPREICAGNRSFDGDLLIATILEATSSVCINVMDFAPVSLYEVRRVSATNEPPLPVWWPALFDALLHAATTRRVDVRLLVSEWAHTSVFIAPYLAALSTVADAAAADPRMSPGGVEVRRFRVPGWRQTGPKTNGEDARYPGHSRVNHVKYVVTDRRLNVGTSNMTWDYFNGTAGTSVSATHPTLVRRLQSLFDRDWYSDYSLPLYS